MAPVAGIGGRVETTTSLGTKGVRYMGPIVAAHRIKRFDRPAHVTNHFRALADMAMDDPREGPLNLLLLGCMINDFLDT